MLFVPSFLPPKNKHTFCTGQRIPRGTTKQSQPFSGIELRSCGAADFPIVLHPRLTNIRRYLTKLCDQLVCLVSAEHSNAIVWDEDDDVDVDDISTQSENDESDRLYYFEVAKTNDQEENVIARQGFTVQSSTTHYFLLI